MKLSVPVKGMIFAGMLCLIALLLIGCASPRQNFYAGQGLDIATTYYAIERDGRFHEGNPFMDDMQDVLIFKAVFAGLVEGAAYLDPARADTYYWIGAITGYGAGAINIYTVTK
jgi:hypothetical protein